MLYRILAVMALFFFAACGGGPRDLEPQRRPVNDFGVIIPLPADGTVAEPAVPQAKVVKVGLLVPLSGQAAAVGTALQDAATLALMDKYHYVDEAGNHVKVVLVPKDTQGTPAGAAAAARAVLASGAQLIVGPLFSQNVEPVAAAARQYGVNVLTFSNNPDVAGDNVFVFGFQAEQQVKRVLDYALNRNLSHIALLGPNNAYGSAVKQSATRTMQASGLALEAEQYYSPVGNADAEIDLLAVAHTKSPFNAVLVPEGGQKLTAIVQGLRTRGIAQPDVRFLGTGVWDEPAILRSGALAGGWFASSPPDRFAAYERRFQEFFGYAPPRLSALAYDALALAASLAINRQEGNPFSTVALTDPVGYNGPVNGIFRCQGNGICERGLAVLEVTGKGSAQIIDAAPDSFRN